MKSTFTGPAPLYKFLSECNINPLDKIVLDCGAGGSQPPLTVFKENGYQTHGIDISESQLVKAQQFCQVNNMDLGIIKGDMRAIPFADESMSFVYCYSSICHMSKDDAEIAMKDLTRVLKKTGLCFVSFCIAGKVIPENIEPRSPGEYPYKGDGLTGVHTLYDDTEPDGFFCDYKIIWRERRWIENYSTDKKNAWAEICYIACKL